MEAMAMPPPPPDRDLKELIEAKERELADLGDYRLAQLEAGVRDRDHQLNLAAQRLDKLKEDFSYNLSLIAERDAELATLEEERGQLRDAVRDRDDRLEELRGEVADREKALEGGNESAAQREAYWQSKLGELRSECDALRWEAKESARAAKDRAAKESEIPNFKGSYLGRFHSFWLILGRAIISRNGLEA